MATDLMRYDLLAQEALRGVIREALIRATGPEGLPGAHHFYISFKTEAPGVDIDESLKERYPEEMTIVLEHQFWDLNPQDDYFEVTLKFGGVPKYLKVPYSAVNRFHDPSVGFHLQFEPTMEAVANTGNDDEVVAEAPPKLEPKADKKKDKAAKEEDAPKTSAKASGDGAEVVSLDSFRKK
ncbi:SspB family protein [Hyphobacterium sp.]|uniref:SspB family protein n=1 Tax=Hyphobacterium sp. TaxID=2004662 RepID=UPI003BAC842A